MRHLAGLFAAAAVLIHTPVFAQQMVEHGAEHRLQLDFRVPDGALAKFLPADWTTNIATQGPAKDANIRLICIDRVAVTDKSKRPIGKGGSRLVYLAVPVNGPAGATGQMIIGGLTSNADDAPGPFNNYISASVASVQRSVAADGAKVIRDETWKFAAPSGEFFELHVKLEAAPTPKSAPSETKFFDPKTPSTYQTFRVEQVLDIARNATTGVNRVSEYAFKGGGGAFKGLFDGSETLLSVDSIPWYSRTISTP